MRPYAVDIASGIEAAPGHKDPERLRAFFQAVAAQPPSRRRSVSRRERAGRRAGARASLRALRRPVRARDADAGAGGARAGVARGARGPRLPRASWTGCCATSPGARRRCTGRARLSERVGRPVYLKREDLNHTGSHKLNNALGQALLAKRMGKRRIIAETGAGQHGVATATACALLDLECVVYMGVEDMRRQRPNVAADGAAGRARRAGRRRRANAQGGDLGGDPRLGDERRRARTT